MKRVTATMIGILHICHRELWLHANGINMENATDNPYVADGKLISETTYTRRASRWKELSLKGVKIDYYDPDTNTVREVKKSPKLEHAHTAQVQYYLYMLEKHGLQGASGVIEYPKQKKTTEVQPLTDSDRTAIAAWESEIQRITEMDSCPDLVPKSYCKTCAFYDFCYV